MTVATKVFLVVGGTSGIGLEIADTLAKHAIVYAGGRRALAEKPNLKSIPLDVTDENSIAKCLAQIKNESARLDGVVYSAGLATKPHPIEETDVEKWSELLRVNVTGAMLCAKHAYALLKATTGRVVFINSIAGKSFSKTASIGYTTSKAALLGFARQLAYDWARDKILVNSICPSQTLTPMLHQNVSKEKIKVLEEQVPLGRLATPKEIAAFVEFLLSEKNTYMTGCSFDMNGGQLLS